MDNPKAEDLPRILILGDATVPTGFARVIYHIFAPLSSDFEIHQLGVNYRGDEHNWPWRIYPAMDGDGPFGFSKVEALAERVDPSLVFMVSDDGPLAEWMKRLSQWKGRAGARAIVYCPVDNNPLKAAVADELYKADRLFTYTDFGRRCFAECKTPEEVRRLEVEVMPHGIDTAVFRPLEGDIEYHLSPEGRLRAKRNLVGADDSQLDGTFIVLNANRNQERKRQDTTIRGFARFAAGKPDSVRLYLHCGVKDIGWNVVELAAQEGIMDRLILSTTQGLKPNFPDEEMNKIYGACELGINTSSAEGWGLVNFEHAATGAAQLAPDHTGCSELWTGYAAMLRPAVSTIDTYNLKEHYIISPETVADALERMYVDRDYHHAMCVAAYKNATREEYQWGNISNKWLEVFREELDKLRALAGPRA
jgi:glycosyltransferase involved in cell wall biosynthesis